VSCTADHHGVGHHPVRQTAHQVERLVDRRGAVGRAELQRRLLFEVNGIDGDDLRGAVDPGALDRSRADAAGADHDDGVPGAHVGAVRDGTVAGRNGARQ
jgi:hypothetical protein